MSLIAIGVAIVVNIAAVWLGWSLALFVSGKIDMADERTFPESLRWTASKAKYLAAAIGVILALILLFFLVVAGWTWAFGGRIV